jgi:hypothetical protein
VSPNEEETILSSNSDLFSDICDSPLRRCATLVSSIGDDQYKKITFLISSLENAFPSKKIYFSAYDESIKKVVYFYLEGSKTFHKHQISLF